jgi:ankyrin repeat protein
MNQGLFCLPREVIRIIITCCPCGQWFKLCKQLHILASQVIPPVEFRIADGGALLWAIRYNKKLAVSSLLQHPHVDPSEPDNCSCPICHASQFDNKEIMELLLQDKRVDPSAHNNFAIQMASYAGHTEIVKLLLQDKRVDPSADNNYAIRLASYAGRTEVVKLLLQDRRVDPSAQDNYAIRMASHYGYTKIVKLLLHDKRVDAAAADNTYATRTAASWRLCNCEVPANH